MTALAVIPAKQQSRRVPGKNFRYLGDRPLWRWTWDAATAALGNDWVIVSSDAAVAFWAGMGQLRWKVRDPALCGDEVSAVDVVIDAVESLPGDYMPAPDVVVMLLPTSPFRTGQQITRALELFHQRGRFPLKSVTPEKAASWYRDGNMEGIQRLDEFRRFKREWWMPKAYRSNGAIQIARWDELQARRSFDGPKTVPYIMDEITGLDIDTEAEWKLAEAWARYGLNRVPANATTPEPGITSPAA